MIKPEAIIRPLAENPVLRQNLLLRAAKLCADIPAKISHFQLPEEKVENIYLHRALLDAATNVSIEKENLRNFTPSDLFGYAQKLEKKYSGDISLLRLITDNLVRSKLDMVSRINAACFYIKNFNNPSNSDLARTEMNVAPMFQAPLEDFIHELAHFAGEANPSERILGGWLLHFAILNALSSEPHYQILARLAHKVYLQETGLGATGLLFLSPELLPQQQNYKKTVEQLKYRKWESFTGSDPARLFNFGLSVQVQALENTNELLQNVYHEMVEYDEMTPRQRNMVNYFFDEGFKSDRPETAGLNERQQKIIELIYERHFISTKDLSLIFRVNRKTIQRDFNELLDMNLVRAMGNGSALRYSVPIRMSPNPTLQKFQNVNLIENVLQISLFDSQSPKTTKPEAMHQRALFD